mmetsp:Transcript_13407/g.19610  ORF Transcript_13407/g.19610 Transcript_13407/m.19610 type:complete len:88 (+) Transcript_13407:145-408(+)
MRINNSDTEPAPNNNNNNTHHNSPSESTNPRVPVPTNPNAKRRVQHAHDRMGRLHKKRSSARPLPPRISSAPKILPPFSLCILPTPA